MNYQTATRRLIYCICEQLELDPINVRNIYVEPRQITVEVYSLNQRGRKYLGNNGDIATETRSLQFAMDKREIRDVLLDHEDEDGLLEQLEAVMESGEPEGESL